MTDVDYNKAQAETATKDNFWRGFTVACSLFAVVLSGLVLLGWKLNVFAQKCMLF